jgi:uncharacterized damage-inducible protein DinB
MLQLGARSTPVVAKGRHFVFGQNLEEVAAFLGLHGTGHVPMPPDELFAKWVRILRAAQRYVRQMPDEQMSQRGTHNRDRPIRLICHHIFRIGEAHLECAAGGAKDLEELTRVAVQDGTFTTGEEIARYGDEVIDRLEQWWARLSDKSLIQQLEIDNYGPMSMHQLLDRSTWHSTHHTRQIVDVLERLDIVPNGKFTKEDVAGMPLPERIWD